MGHIIAVYGIIGGVIVAVGMLMGIEFVPAGGTSGMIVGYLSMLIAMTMVFVGVKRFRDTHKGGVIRFWPAAGVGLGIALVASLFYVAAWEVYLYATDYGFMEKYVAQTLQAMRSEGKSAAEIAAFATQMDTLKVQYANPIFRMAITLSEIAPVGAVVALVSAAILRNSRAFPAVAARG